MVLMQERAVGGILQKANGRQMTLKFSDWGEENE